MPMGADRNGRTKQQSRSRYGSKTVKGWAERVFRRYKRIAGSSYGAGGGRVPRISQGFERSLFSGHVVRRRGIGLPPDLAFTRTLQFWILVNRHCPNSSTET